MDHLTPQQRHNTMAAIRNKNTKPEMIVRRGLWKRGFRYRLNHKRLPGHPDLVLRKYRTCIFINGCFWHGHLVDSSTMESSACCKIPSTNHDFWVAKIRMNKERDKEEQSNWQLEVKMSDRVVALPTVQSKLRLYCLRLSDKILILGNGGVKNTKTYEESKELSGYVLTLQNFDRLIKEGVKDGTIMVSENKIETDKTFDL